MLIHRSPAWLLLVGCLAFAVVAPAHAQDLLPIAEARGEGAGAEVTVEGTVTRAYGDFVRFQDESGPTGASGLVIRQPEGSFHDDVADGTIGPGTTLRVAGTLSDFNGLLQINEDDLASYELLGEDAVPVPQDVTLSELRANGENYASELVQVKGVRLLDASDTFVGETSYGLSDRRAVLTFRIQTPEETELGGTAAPDAYFTYVGVVGRFYNDFQLIPVRTGDLQAQPFVAFTALYSLAEEADDDVAVRVRAFNFDADQQAAIEASAGGTADPNSDVNGFSNPAAFTLSGSTPAETITLEPLEDSENEGIERLELSLSSDDVDVTRAPFTLWVLDDSMATTTLYSDLEDEALVQQLQDDFGDPSTLGYDVARDTLFATVLEAAGDSLYGFYTGFARFIPEDADPTEAACNPDTGGCTGNDAINTEHFWPQSFGAGDEPARSNMHILAPARGDVNTARSNHPFGEIPDEQTTRWYVDDASRTEIPSDHIDAYSEFDGVNDRFEPRERMKGDVARAMFYFRTIYADRADPGFFIQQAQTLLDWNAADPPSPEEIQHNLRAASYQGNKINPFVLDPSLAERAYGDIADETPRSIAEARAAPLGTMVTVEGTVSRAYGSYARLQDESGSTGASGIVVRQTSGSLSTAFQQDIEDGTIQPGTVLRVTGTTSAFNELIQINDADLIDYEAVEQSEPPAPQSVTLDELSANGADYVSELVHVEALTLVNPGDTTFSTNASYTVEDAASTTLTFRIQRDNETALGGTDVPTGRFDYEGVVGVYNNDYQFIPVRPGDLTARTAPPATFPVDVTVPFSEPVDTESYRLVALPGAIDRAIETTLDGEAGTDWQAFWDNGSDEDFLDEFNGSDAFHFQPGRGFWLASRADWTVDTEVDAVALDANDTTTIPLHEDWNIIANPFDIDVAWAAVEAANGGTLQPIWAYDGAFDEAATFASARTGQAFYFFNDGARDALEIPYVPAPTAAAPQAEQRAPAALTLRAQVDDALRSTVQMGTAPDAADGLDAHDAVAPPAPFQSTTLYATSISFRDEAAPTRQHRLARDVRAADRGNHVFDLVLQAEPGQPVTLALNDADAFPGANVVLVDRDAGTTYALRATSTARLRPTRTHTALRVLVGDDAFIAAEQDDMLPDELRLYPNYPNPFAQTTTLTYDLPTASDVHLAVYDVLGRRVRVLVDKQQTAGRKQITFDAPHLPSGVYFVRLDTGLRQLTQRLTLVR